MSVLDTRMSNLRQRMAETKTDLVFLGPSSHMKWLADLSPHGDERPVLLVVSDKFAGFVMPALNVDSSRAHTKLPFFAWSDDEGATGALEALLNEAVSGRENLSIVLDETMRADFALLVIDALPGAKRRFTDDTVSYLRSRKDAAEYEILKANALINDGAMQAAFAALKPGVTELEIASVVREFYVSQGARQEFISVCFGGNGAFPHHHTGNTALKADDVALIDIGGRSDGYPSDMTRVATIGKGHAQFDELHGVLERAVQAALAASKPGVKARDVDKAARDVIVAAGFGERFVHRTGHGLGIDIHEMPYITATAETVLEEGMVYSIEPGIYLSGQLGVRLEEIVILRADGAEVLSGLSREAYRA